MQLTLEKVLTFDCLNKAVPLTNKKGLSKRVTSIMIMEAPDVENWAHAGVMILSSYFALQHLSDKELQQLFKKMRDLNVAAFVLKKDRLITDIPVDIVDYCELFNVPLIQIPKETQYETILLEVMRALLNQNLSLLDIYHKAHNRFTRLALTEPTLEETLEVLKSLIHQPVTLINELTKDTFSTDPELADFYVIEMQPLNKKHYMNFDYTRCLVNYETMPDQKNPSILTAMIPNVNRVPYQLVIHEQDGLIADEAYMAIENAISFLQMELLKHYALSQNDLTYRNEILSDLLNNRTENREEFLQKAAVLKLDPSKSYQVIVFTFKNILGHLDTLQKQLFQFRVYFLEQLAGKNLRFAYQVRKDKIVLIMEQTIDQAALKDVLESNLALSKKITKTEELKINGSISMSGSLFDLPDRYNQAQDIQRAIELFGKSNQLYTYADIGVFQLFLKSANAHELQHYIPEKLLSLHQQNPELTETLKVFLDTTQNFKLTGDKLFVHPKTVRYRINKIKELTGIDFLDPEELLQYNIGLRLLSIMPADN